MEKIIIILAVFIIWRLWFIGTKVARTVEYLAAVNEQLNFLKKNLNETLKITFEDYLENNFPQYLKNKE